MTAVFSQRRVVLLVLVAALVATVGGSILARGASAEEPLRWRPFVLASASAVRPAAPPSDPGSAADRAELDEIVALQAGTAAPSGRLVYWTGQPSVTRWNEVLLSVVRIDRTNPVRVARVLALLNTAMYDAVIAACDAKVAFRRGAPASRDARITALAPPDELSAYASVDAAIAGAAVAVLSYVYPGRSREFEALAAEVSAVRLTAGTHTRSDLAAGDALGRAVGAQAVARGKADGSTQIWRGTIPTFEGVWAAARPFRNDIPLEPLAGTWTPWLMSSGSALRPGPPPAYKSAQWQAEADEVVRVNANLSDEQVRIARFWADGSGTDTPPGHWVRIALGLIVRDKLSLPDAARTLAYLGTSQADAFISSWDAKYVYWSGRPIGLIPGFASTVITPNFPAYTSGHSTLSGASSVTLGWFFPGDRPQLAAMADEAAISRLYGGIHWRSDNDVGLTVGKQIGQLAIDRARGDRVAR